MSILEIRDVKYFMDENNNYYKKINNYTIKKISKEDFYLQSKYNPKTIYKLLNESVYPYQINDYILLRVPKWLKELENVSYNKKYIPADYQLANLIKFLWKKRIIINNWNQPKNKFGGKGSLQCFKNTINGKSVIDIFIELFGENNIIMNDKVKNPNKIVIIIDNSDLIHISFLQKKLEWMHKKLDITMPKKSDASKGGIILTKGEFDTCIVDKENSDILYCKDD